MMIDAASESPNSSSSGTVLSSGAIASRMLEERKPWVRSRVWKPGSSGAMEADVPTDGADKVEVDNEAPCYAFLVEGGRGMQELEL